MHQKRFGITSLNEAMDQYGWVITGVPGLALYTVGLIDKFDQPEICICGLPTLKADGILRSAVERVQLGTKILPGGRYNQIVRNFDVKAIEVDHSNFHDWFGQALDYHGAELSMVQILWPDTTGKFPGEQAYDQNFSGQLRFDVHRPEYEDMHPEHLPGEPCAHCGEEL